MFVRTQIRVESNFLAVPESHRSYQDSWVISYILAELSNYRWFGFLFKEGKFIERKIKAAD